MRAVIRRMVRGRLAPALVWLAVLAVSHVALVAGAILGNPVAFALAWTVAMVAESRCSRRAPRILAALGRAYAGVSHRVLARDAALLLLVAIANPYDAWVLPALSAGVAGVHLLRAGILGLRAAVGRLRKLPIIARNLDISALRIPDAPPRWVIVGGRARTLLLGLPATVGVLADLLGNDLLGIAPLLGGGLGLVGAAASLAVGVAAAAVLAGSVLRARHLADQAWVRSVVMDAVRAYAPEVVLYYSSGERATRYQVDMWLEPLSKVPRRSIILVRETMHLFAIGQTTMPVVCLPSGTDVMNLDVPELRVALYPGNVGKNIHMLRNLNIKHVFVGHGDSDKASSAVPISRVYDEIWVAGRAGRDRYHRAGVGVRDENIVEVGRPQLGEIETAAPHRPMFTVLYAPTWEGWSQDMMLTSVHVMGIEIVRRLCEASPEIRILYKPHPMIGIRDREVAAAHKEIIRMLAEADRLRAQDPHWTDVLAQAEEQRAAARATMAELDSEARALRTRDRRADQAQRARDSVHVDPAALERLAEIDREWRAAYWVARGWWRHTVVTGTRPSLYSCFDEADLMISDISSVVSDFIASGKPYVMTNPGDVDADAFRAEQTAAGGAYLLGRDCADLESILDAVRSGPADPMAERREQTREYLLGPTEPDSMTRFVAAVERLCVAGDAAAAARQALGAAAADAADTDAAEDTEDGRTDAPAPSTVPV